MNEHQWGRASDERANDVFYKMIICELCGVLRTPFASQVCPKYKLAESLSREIKTMKGIE